MNYTFYYITSSTYMLEMGLPIQEWMGFQKQR